MRQSRNSFLFYATGRRFCQGLTAHIELKRRQDLFSMASYRLAPRDDYIDMEIVMNDTCMPPMVRTFRCPKPYTGLPSPQCQLHRDMWDVSSQVS